MTPNRQDGLAALQGGAYRGRESAATFRQTYCPQPRASSPEGHLLAAADAGGLAGYLLGLTVSLVFCSGLVALAVSSLFEVAVPRWLILADGIGCVVVALLALLLTRPWQQLQPSARQQPCRRKGAGATRDGAATWNGMPKRGSGTPHGAPSASIL
jgi:hypothetical protein